MVTTQRCLPPTDAESHLTLLFGRRKIWKTIDLSARAGECSSDGGPDMTRRRALVLLCGVALGSSPIATIHAAPDGGPAQPVVSNMGLCSAFLAQAGVRADVNHLIREFGPFLPDGPYESPGELYRIRAREHPDASAAEECLER